MNVTTASLERIDQHWAIQAIGNEEINRAIDLSNRLLVEKAVGGVQIHFNYTFSPSDYELLDRVSMAYEMAAIEGLNDFLNPTELLSNLVFETGSSGDLIVCCYLDSIFKFHSHDHLGKRVKPSLLAPGFLSTL